MRTTKLFFTAILLLIIKSIFAQDSWYQHHLIPPASPVNLNAVDLNKESIFVYGITVGSNGFVAYWTSPTTEVWLQCYPITNNNLNSVCLVDSIAAIKSYIVGDHGCIIKMNNYPGNQYLLNSPTNRNLYSVYFLNCLTGIIVGDTGTVIKTTDGGSHWNMITAVTQNRYYSVNFPSNNTGYAVGANGIVIKTTDNGNNWAIKTSPVIDTLRCVWFTDDNTGYVVSRNGAIYKTTNGGTSWQSKPSGTTQHLNAIRFSSANVGYAAGNNSLVIKTTNGGDSWQIQGIPASGNCKSIGINRSGNVAIVGSYGLAVGNYPDPLGVILENNKESNMQLYPNPFKEAFAINYNIPKENKKAIFQLYDVYGKLVYQIDLTTSVNQLQVVASSLKSGLYFASLVVDDVIIKTAKIIKD